MTFDSKTIASIGGAALLAAGAASGYLYVSTPAAQECEVELAKHQVRLELYKQATVACKHALSDNGTLDTPETSP